MDLLSLFLFTESILAIILSFFLIGILIVLLNIIKAVNEAKRGILTAADEVIETAETAKNTATKVGKSITDYLVIKMVNSINKKGRRGDRYESS